jgi:hypothetical protein
MSQFRCQGIDEALAAEVRSSMRSPQYGHPAHRELAQGRGPRRLCLRTFAVGEDDRILFTYDAPELPPDFRALPLVFEAYRAGGELLARERVGARNPDEVLAALLCGGADYLHIRNGEAGCFMAAVRR